MQILILDEGLNAIVPPILALLDVPVEDPQWTTLDPQQRRRHTLEAIKRLLLRESQLQPVPVVFEDLHWSDSETQALLDSLVESLPTTRILLLTNYRPEYEHGWTRKTYYTQVRLDPLAAESADALLRALVGEDPGLESLKALLITRTEGNPFFLEDSVRTLVETRVLSGEPRAYRVAKAVDPTQVPATVQAVLAARIDRLPPDEKRLLQSASVLRKDVPVGLLHAIADLSDDGLRQGLAHLQVAEFLYETHLFPNLEYTFKHALTLEVTYQSLLHERRRALHARVVDAIERLFPDRLIEQIGSSASAALSGTSMAAPHVAGAAALYLEANPSATPETVRQVLIENATRDQVENSGPGSPNYLLYTGFVVGDPERFATSPQSAMRRSTDRRPDPQAHHRPRNRGNSTTRRGPATNRCRVPI